MSSSRIHLADRGPSRVVKILSVKGSLALRVLANSLGNSKEDKEALATFSKNLKRCLEERVNSEDSKFKLRDKT
jgi:hypothetical protein